MKHLFSLLFVVVSTFGSAQDLHFTQTTQTPLLINPGATGVYDGWERIIMNHRNQWIGAGTQFMTSALSADANFFKSVRNDKAHMGVGLQVFNDIGGDSQFGHQQVALSMSGILPMGGYGHVLSVGLQGGYGFRSGNTNALTFRSQWNGTEFDQLILSGEQNALSSFRYMEANAGIYYEYDGGQNTFQRNKDFKFTLGVAGFHLNKPELLYNNGTTDRLHRKFVAHAGVVSEIGTSVFSIDASAAEFMQASHFETLFGLMLRYRFEDGTKITGNAQDAFFGIGMYTRLKDAIMPSVMIDWRGFRFGVSYDVTVSALRRAYSGGSLEFSLSYVNKDHALFKRRGRKF